mgnify:CR=1 FL=1
MFFLWSISELKIFMIFIMIYKLYKQKLTPGRYRAPKFGQPKKGRQGILTICIKRTVNSFGSRNKKFMKIASYNKREIKNLCAHFFEPAEPT